MISYTQASANQNNAQKSTGPITEEGKAKVANNAIKHGLFSKRLILSDEDPVEYQTLFQQLQSELAPTGILEQTLVERISVSLWRQKRLVRAESACIELERKPKHIVDDVNQNLGINYTDQSLSDDDLTEFDADQLQWCKNVLLEYEKMDFGEQADMAILKKSFPLTYQQLISDAEQDKQSPTEYLSEFNEPWEYFVELARYAREQIKSAEQRPFVLEIAAMVRNKRAILRDKTRESLGKYQIMLDNELYKAMKALREAQDWRLKSLPIIPESKNGFVLEN